MSWKLTFTKQALKDANLSGAYSRRINIQHRLVYQVFEEEKVVRGCLENSFSRRRCDEKVARRETSGIKPINLRALKMREECSVRVFNAGINLQSVPDVSRLEQIAALRQKNFQTASKNFMNETQF
jgi:hypothetical protein